MHIFKLSQDCTYNKCVSCTFYVTPRYVAQAYLELYGNSLKSCAVAIIIPDEEVVSVWDKENNISDNFTELCTNDGVGLRHCYGLCVI